MTFKWIPPIHIHPILTVFIIISFITGTFMELAIILSIVLFHEIGHYLVAHFYKWRVKHIMLWIFGGVMETDEHGNRPIYEEVFVTIAGPLQHVVIYLLLSLLLTINFIPLYIFELAIYYNIAILFFNLLPIWPLDGGKIFMLFLSSIFPYKKSYYFVIISSIILSVLIIVLQLLLFPFKLSTFLIFIFLIMENKKEWEQRYYVFIRFLLQRFEEEAYVRGIDPLVVHHHTLLMDVFSLFRREKRHHIYITFPEDNRKMTDETVCLRSYFYEKKYNTTVGELISRQV